MKWIITVCCLCAPFSQPMLVTSGYAESLRIVAVSNRQAPGTLIGSTFSSFEAPALNNAGLVAFTATLTSGQAMLIASGGAEFGRKAPVSWRWFPEGIQQLQARPRTLYSVLLR